MGPKNHLLDEMPEMLMNVSMEIMATIFGFLYMGSHWRHLAYTTTVRVRQRCGLMSNYLDHLFGSMSNTYISQRSVVGLRHRMQSGVFHAGDQLSTRP